MSTTCAACDTDNVQPHGICSECWWELSPAQEEDPHKDDGPNHVSLKEARANYEAFGACDSHGLWCKTGRNVSDTLGLDFGERWLLHVAWSGLAMEHRLGRSYNRAQHAMALQVWRTRGISLRHAAVYVEAMLNELMPEDFGDFDYNDMEVTV